MTARFERRRAELQAASKRERVTLKAKFDAARLEIDAERAELQKQLEEERRRPAVIEKHVDEEAITQRLEHLRAELQQQFARELKTNVQMELAAQRQMLEQDSQREIEKVRRAADERIAAMRTEIDGLLAQQAAAGAEAQQQQLPRPRPAAPPAQRSVFSSFFHRGPKPQLKLNQRAISGESTATRRAAAVAVAESSATRRAKAAPVSEQKARVLFLESRRATADTAAPRLRQLGIEIVIVERLVDAVDEIYRFRPDIIFLDAGLSDFEGLQEHLRPGQKPADRADLAQRLAFPGRQPRGRRHPALRHRRNRRSRAHSHETVRRHCWRNRAGRTAKRRRPSCRRRRKRKKCRLLATATTSSATTAASPSMPSKPIGAAA